MLASIVVSSLNFGKLRHKYHYLLSTYTLLMPIGFYLGRLCLLCAATKRKCAMTKEESKKSQRVFSKGMGVMERKTEKGKGKEKESGKNWKQDKEEDDDKYVEDGEAEVKAGWRGFMTTRMVMIGLVVEKLQVENEMLREEIWDMREGNTGPEEIF